MYGAYVSSTTVSLITTLRNCLLTETVGALLHITLNEPNYRKFDFKGALDK